GGGGSSPAPNLCECSAALGEVDCSDCFNANAALGAPCAAEAAACSGDAGCDAIRLCVQACDDAACKHACILPFDADASHGLWRDVLMCVCGRCVEACAHKPALECDEGAGGAGGGAGGGGAGGGGVGGG
ncbi:MAG: hypothetical protein IT372_36045, partial [Polyangiaceae bacterium]|nr:hypothetical protein [Polyangiaceae bacterium]